MASSPPGCGASSTSGGIPSMDRRWRTFGAELESPIRPATSTRHQWRRTHSEVVYVSDSGSHANLWATDLATGESRQLTFEQDPDRRMGLPLWSPDGRLIAYFVARGSSYQYFLINADGSNSRLLMRDAGSATWSPDGKWLYYNDYPAGKSPSQDVGRWRCIRDCEGGQRVSPGDRAGQRDAVLRDRAAGRHGRIRPRVSGGNAGRRTLASARAHSGWPYRALAGVSTRDLPGRPMAGVTPCSTEPSATCGRSPRPRGSCASSRTSVVGRRSSCAASRGPATAGSSSRPSGRVTVTSCCSTA